MKRLESVTKTGTVLSICEDASVPREFPPNIMIKQVSLIVLTVVIAGCSQQTSQHDQPATINTSAKADMINSLQDGGYIVYFRHAQTEKDYADQLTADPENCATQRTLSEAGWNQAKSIKTGFDALDIPVGDVISSEYCRAWQTAELAFGKHVKNADLNFLPFEEYTDEQVEEMREKVMPMLIKTPAAGTNTIIVGHDDIFESATGIYPEPQGVAYILKPDGNDFEIVGNVMPDEWLEIK